VRREDWGAHGALQSIWIRRSTACPGEDSVLLFSDWLLVQSLRPAEVSPVLLRRSRFAVGRFLGCAVFPQRAVPEAVKFPTFPLFEFGLRLEPFPTNPSRPCRSVANSSLGLCFPSALEDSEIHSLRVGAYPLRSARRVWLPSRRLTPSEPLPVLFHTGGALGIFPSELSPLARLPKRFRIGRTHLPFSPALLPPPEGFGPARRASVSGLRPLRESLANGHGISTPNAGCSLGFYPSRAFRWEPCLGFRPGSSHVLGAAGGEPPTLPAPQSLTNSHLAKIEAEDESPTSHEATLLGFSHRHKPVHLSEAASGLWVHLTPRQALLPAGRRS
jgi:hypothetical protein